MIEKFVHARLLLSVHSQKGLSVHHLLFARKSKEIGKVKNWKGKSPV